MIYLCKIVDMPFLKVGYSENFESRLYALNQSMPFRVECLAERNGSWLLEKRIHLKCAPHAIKNEWYNDCENVRRAFFSELDPEPALKSRKDRYALKNERLNIEIKDRVDMYFHDLKTRLKASAS